MRSAESGLWLAERWWLFGCKLPICRGSRAFPDVPAGLGAAPLYPSSAGRLPNGLSYSDLHTSLKADGFVIYAGQGHLGKEIFRIAHMGDIHNDDLDRLEVALRKCLA